MQMLFAGAGALLFTCGIAACGGDQGAPGPGGTASGGTVADSGAEGGAQLGNAAQGCTGNAQCQSNFCFMGNMQSFCTVTCTADNATTACVTPFTGTCNKMGYCKRD